MLVWSLCWVWILLLCLFWLLLLLWLLSLLLWGLLLWFFLGFWFRYVGFFNSWFIFELNVLWNRLILFLSWLDKYFFRTDFFSIYFFGFVHKKLIFFSFQGMTINIFLIKQVILKLINLITSTNSLRLSFKPLLFPLVVNLVQSAKLILSLHVLPLNSFSQLDVLLLRKLLVKIS